MRILVCVLTAAAGRGWQQAVVLQGIRVQLVCGLGAPVTSPPRDPPTTRRMVRSDFAFHVPVVAQPAMANWYEDVKRLDPCAAPGCSSLLAGTGRGTTWRFR